VVLRAQKRRARPNAATGRYTRGRARNCEGGCRAPTVFLKGLESQGGAVPAAPSQNPGPPPLATEALCEQGCPGRVGSVG